MEKRKARQGSAPGARLALPARSGGSFALRLPVLPVAGTPLELPNKGQQSEPVVYGSCTHAGEATGPLGHVGMAKQLDSRNLLWLAGHSHLKETVVRACGTNRMSNVQTVDWTLHGSLSKRARWFP